MNTVLGDNDINLVAVSSGLVTAVIGGSLGVTSMLVGSFHTPVIIIGPVYPAASTTRYCPAGTLVNVNSPIVFVRVTIPVSVKLPITVVSPLTCNATGTLFIPTLPDTTLG